MSGWKTASLILGGIIYLLHALQGAPPRSLIQNQTVPGDLGVDRAIWFSIRADGQPGDGTVLNPFNGSGNRFDVKMHERSVLNPVTNIVIHLLPGVYETQGTLVWNPRSGWRILGAGIDKTFVKLVNVSNNVWGVIAQPSNVFESNTEVSDLTVDCNYSATNPSTASAVQLIGQRHTIRRVKAINAFGRLPDSETFILTIGNAGQDSDGNLIEECEVSSFKGTYCSAIAFGGPVGGTKTIGGIVRGNRVYDLHGGHARSTAIAFACGATGGALFENNVAYRCDIAVNNDTGKSLNVIFRGNQFYACRTRGIGLVGDDLENYIIEDNLIEIDPIRADWGIVISDGSGNDRVRNFKIRNNVIRPLSGLVGFAGGLGIFAVRAEGFSITGNRVEGGLRSAFSGSGVSGFDNTDFVGNPLSTFEGRLGNQVNLPRGEAGTLLLNKGNAYVMAEVGANPEANGRSLVAAYAKARAMRPHGEALSTRNRVTLFVFPGRYVLGDGALVIDTPYVDVIGLGDPGAIRLESPGNTLIQLADNVILENLTLYSSSASAPSFGPQDKAAYFPESNLAGTVIKNCTFTGENNGWGMRLGITYAGKYLNSDCSQRGWGGPGIFSGAALNCSAGDFSFGAGGVFSGAATNCRAGLGSFGTGAFRGIAKNCTAGHGSFGGTGHLIGCEVTGGINSTVVTTGKLTDCRIGPAPDNVAAIVIGTGARLYNCTLLANPGGTGFSIDALAPVSARVAHCRLNHGMRNVVNEIAQPFNVEDPGLE